jgi:hypothetical protein
MQIVINTEYDLTPAGKRVARVVQTSRGGRQLRWYVGGRLYWKGAPAEHTSEWLAGEGGPLHHPQPWSGM